LFLRAYSLGGGTYTGIEAVSNNVQSLAEPRVATGKWTMFYMAVSLSFTAGGIILLYLLWSVTPVEGQTLNAVTFRAIIENVGWQAPVFENALLWIVLALEGSLLFVAANTGFLGGPAVLANMAADSWVPHMYRYLSTRLVTQNGILLMGITSLGILLVTGGRVALLVVLYSINVFLTFSMSLVGLVIYWWQHRQDARWRHRLLLSVGGLIVYCEHPARYLDRKIHRGRLDDGADHGHGDRLLPAQSSTLRKHQAEDPHRRRGTELDRLSRRRRTTPARSCRADCGVRGGIKPQRWRLGAAVGAPRISRALQELPVHERAHGRCPELRR